MPFNGSGTYVPPGLPVYPPSPGSVISSSYFTQLMSDMFSALSLTFLRDGSVAFTGDFNVGSNAIKGLSSGAVGAPSVRFQADTTSGIWLNGAGKLALSAGGVKALEAISTGITIPIDLLVQGIAHFISASTVTDGAGTDRFIGYRNVPFTAATAGRTLALTDVGMCIPATGAINIPTNATVAFAIGDLVAVYNNSAGSISITASGGVTLRLGGSATTGTRTLTQRGYVTLLKVGTDEWVALNGGIS